MATKKKLLQAAAGAAGGEILHASDVFSTYVYEGSGSTQTITNNIAIGAGGGFQTTALRETQSRAYATATDSSDNVYIAFKGNDGTASDGVIVGKFTSTGTNVWYAGLRNNSVINDIPYSMAVDSNGNVYVVGRGAYTSSQSRGFLAKFNSSGTLQYQRSLYINASNTSQEFAGVAIDSSDNVYVVGTYYRSAISNVNGLIAKYNSSGTLQFQKDITSPYILRGRSIAIDSGGNIIASFAGKDGSNVDNTFVLKLDSSGNQTWQHRIYNPSNQSTYASYNGIVIDSNDNYYICNNYSSYFILTKFNSGGTRQWIGWPGLNGNNGTTVFMDSSDNLYVTSGQDSVGNIQKVDISNGNVTGGFKFFDYPREDSSSTGSVVIRQGAFLSTGKIALAISAENGGDSYRATLVLADNDVNGGTSFYKSAGLGTTTLSNSLNSTSASTSICSVATGTLSATTSVLSSYTPTVSLTAYPEFEATDGEGGLLWLKNREGATNHRLYTTDLYSASNSNVLQTNLTSAAGNTGSAELQSFNADGFTLGYTGGAYSESNGSNTDYVAWTFRKAPKFFDVVTWDGNNTSGRTLSHNLGSDVGFIVVKCTTNSSTAWTIYHRSLGATKYLEFDGGAVNTAAGYWNNTEPTSTTFTLGNDGNVNATGRSYVAYLFAHNDGDGGFGYDADKDIIKCGSYAGNATSVDLGFEPQFLIIKRTDASENWIMYGVMRGFLTRNQVANSVAPLLPNSANAESISENHGIYLTHDGFDMTSGYTPINNGSASSNYIYIAIARDTTKVITEPTALFDMATLDGTKPTYEPDEGNLDVVDFAFHRSITSTVQDWDVHDRLRQRPDGSGQHLNFNTTNSESSTGNLVTAGMDYMYGWADEGSNTDFQSWMWKRAPNYFDIVSYVGTGSSRTINHSLGVEPEMIWVKGRTNTDNWAVYHKDLSAGQYLQLNVTQAVATNSNIFTTTAPTSSVFSVGSDGSTNGSGQRFISYHFATLEGVSKVGSYVGNGSGSGPTIDCGFSNGARFILIKRVTEAANWFIFDTRRDITASDSPRLGLNNTTAQQYGDYIDPDPSGFQIVTTSSNINASGDTYIFYAIA